MGNELEKRNLGFLGSGRISAVIVQRLIDAKAVLPGAVLVSDLDPAKIQGLVGQFAVQPASSNAEVIEGCDLIVLAVPPQEVLPVLREVRAGLRSGQILVSLAAMVPTSAIEEAAGSKIPVVRVIPNIPSQVGSGMNPFCLGRHVGESEFRVVEELLDVLGESVLVEESAMPIVTALTGMGPTYVLPILQALADAAAECGYPLDEALHLIAQTFRGTASLVLETGMQPRELRKLIPARTVDDAALAEIYSTTLVRLVEGLRTKEGALRPLALSST